VPVEPSLQVGEDQPDRCRRPCGRQDQRHAGSSSAAQVLLRCIDDRLAVGQVVQRRDRPVRDADRLMQHLDRSQAVGGARGCGDDVVSVWVVAVIVDAENDIQCAAVLHRRSDHQLPHNPGRSTGRASRRSETVRSIRERRPRRGRPRRPSPGRPPPTSQSACRRSGLRPWSHRSPEASVRARCRTATGAPRSRPARDLVDVGEGEIRPIPAGPQREPAHAPNPLIPIRTRSVTNPAPPHSVVWRQPCQLALASASGSSRPCSRCIASERTRK
jgi:hypothetical protein